MGFDYFALIHHVDLSPLSADLAHMDQGDLIGLTNYPQEWVEIYQRRNIVANDPILLASHQTNVRFAWDDIGDLINVTAQHREITSDTRRSEEHTSELQSLMRISYAVFCLKKKNTTHNTQKSLTKLE